MTTNQINKIFDFICWSDLFKDGFVDNNYKDKAILFFKTNHNEIKKKCIEDNTTDLFHVLSTMRKRHLFQNKTTNVLHNKLGNLPRYLINSGIPVREVTTIRILSGDNKRKLICDLTLIQSTELVNKTIHLKTNATGCKYNALEEEFLIKGGSLDDIKSSPKRYMLLQNHCLMTL